MLTESQLLLTVIRNNIMEQDRGFQPADTLLADPGVETGGGGTSQTLPSSSPSLFLSPFLPPLLFPVSPILFLSPPVPSPPLPLEVGPLKSS